MEVIVRLDEQTVFFHHTIMHPLDLLNELINKWWISKSATRGTSELLSPRVQQHSHHIPPVRKKYIPVIYGNYRTSWLARCHWPSMWKPASFINSYNSYKSLATQLSNTETRYVCFQASSTPIWAITLLLTIVYYEHTVCVGLNNCVYYKTNGTD